MPPDSGLPAFQKNEKPASSSWKGWAFKRGKDCLRKYSYIKHPRNAWGKIGLVMASAEKEECDPGRFWQGGQTLPASSKADI